MQIGSGEINIHNDNGLATVALRGDFDLANMPALEEAVRDALWPSADVLVDLREVTFLDGRLLHWLLELRRDLAARGGRVLLRPGSRARRVLRVVPAFDTFELVEA